MDKATLLSYGKKSVTQFVRSVRERQTVSRRSFVHKEACYACFVVLFFYVFVYIFMTSEVLVKLNKDNVCDKNWSKDIMTDYHWQCFLIFALPILVMFSYIIIKDFLLMLSKKQKKIMNLEQFVIFLFWFITPGCLQDLMVIGLTLIVWAKDQLSWTPSLY